jgi:hypothetical protein
MRYHDLSHHTLMRYAKVRNHKQKLWEVQEPFLEKVPGKW